MQMQAEALTAEDARARYRPAKRKLIKGIALFLVPLGFFVMATISGRHESKCNRLREQSRLSFQVMNDPDRILANGASHVLDVVSSADTIEDLHQQGADAGCWDPVP